MMVSSFGISELVVVLGLVDSSPSDLSTRATRSWQSRTLTVSVPTAFLNQAGARNETRKATWRDRGSQAGWL